MQLTPEIKAQLAEQKKQCIFCKIASKEQQSKVVFEDERTMAILDIYPALKGHTVFFLKEHYPIMPYIQPLEFNHYFGLFAALSKAVKEALLTTGVNIFIANGGAAGQRSPHFMTHFFPREHGDGFFNFLFKKGEQLQPEQLQIFQRNLPAMLSQHFQRSPASWHQGKGNVPSSLASIYESSAIIYEDEKALCLVSKNAVAPGHMEIYSKVEEKDLEKLSPEDTTHLFSVASFAASIVFDALGAQGTNIIVKSGIADDNPGGKLCLHVIPRKMEDKLQYFLWETKEPSYDLDKIQEKIKEKTWKLSLKKKEKTAAPVIPSPPVLTISDKAMTLSDTKKPKSSNTHEEIKRAIESLR